MDDRNDNVLLLPVLPLRGLVVFPKSLIHFDVGRKKSISAINYAMKNEQMIFLVTQKDAAENDPDISKCYSIGVVAKIVQVIKQPDNSTRVVIEGKFRAGVVTPVFDGNCLMAEVEPYPDKIYKQNSEQLGLMRAVRLEFENYVKVAPRVPNDIIFKVASSKSCGELADYIADNIVLDYHAKQAILEELDQTERLDMLLDILINETYLLSIEKDIVQKARERIEENQRDYFLREQKKIIEEELGEDDNPSVEAEAYADRIYSLGLAEQTETTLIKECKKLMRMPYGSQEASVIRTISTQSLTCRGTTLPRIKYLLPS